MAEKAAVFIDGGYLNKINTEKFKLDYQKLVSCLLGSSMELWRAYYYNCLPYKSSNPSEDDKERFNNAQRFYDCLKKFPRMSVRLGKLKYRGEDKNNKPIFEQKQVDLMLGLDIASVCLSGKVETVILVSGDGDMLPAVKTAKDENIIVRLAHGASDTYDQALWDEADERIALNEVFFQECLLR